MTNLRTPLAQVGGPVERRGDPVFAMPLATAMQAQDADLSEFALVHSFHSYPARMHPGLAKSLLESLRMPEFQTVFDPFCGSGTVTIEGMLAGYRTLGSDLNPLAIRLCRTRTRVWRMRDIADFRDEVERISEASMERVRRRVDSRARISADEMRWYDIHVLKELAGLLEEIRASDSRFREHLEMVFSAIVVKFSKQQADTQEREVQRRIRKGIVSEFFARKAEELAMAWQELVDLVPEKVTFPRYVVSDASRVSNTLGGKFECDLIITSPPYGGTYDYAQHHRRRMAWLNLSPSELDEGEIGARRRFAQGPSSRDLLAKWDSELSSTLLEMARCLRVGGVAAIVIGDALLGGEVFDADEQVQRLAKGLGFRYLAGASQERSEWSAPSGTRREHVISLQREDVDLSTFKSAPRWQAAGQTIEQRHGGEARPGERPTVGRPNAGRVEGGGKAQKPSRQERKFARTRR